MKKALVYELTPNNGRKSFYGKAKCVTNEGIRCLLSYETIVGYEDEKGMHRCSDVATVTTMNHVRAFTASNISKKEWLNLPLEKAPTVYIH